MTSTGAVINPKSAGEVIETVGAVLEKSQGARASAADRRESAQARLDGLPSQHEELNVQTADRIAEMRQNDAMAGAQRLSAIARETEDRKLHEESLARFELKRRAVDEALAILGTRIRERSDTEDILVDQFAIELKERS